MKRFWVVLMAMTMLLGGAMAEESSLPEGVIALNEDETIQIDLDGDGVIEDVTFTVVTDEYDDLANLVVMNDAVEACWETSLYGAEVYIADLDGDGVQEIFVTGDEMSDDYCTYALHYQDALFHPMMFANINRGELVENTYCKYGYGRISFEEDSQIKLTGSQDVLGTYMASRYFLLVDGVFELYDNGIWYNEAELDADQWQYRSLNPVQAISVSFMEGDEVYEGTLQPGERVMITGFDKLSTAFFVTEDGRTGYFTTGFDYENGWGSVIDGISEFELFESIPYAD